MVEQASGQICPEFQFEYDIWSFTNYSLRSLIHVTNMLKCGSTQLNQPNSNVLLSSSLIHNQHTYLHRSGSKALKVQRNTGNGDALPQHLHEDAYELTQVRGFSMRDLLLRTSMQK